MNKCDICGAETFNIKYCSKHREHLNNFTGRDYSREIFRLKKGNKCEICGKIWKVGMRRFDLHHLEECGKLSRAYDRLENIMKYMLACHKCHFGHHLHPRQLNA